MLCKVFDGGRGWLRSGAPARFKAAFLLAAISAVSTAVVAMAPVASTHTPGFAKIRCVENGAPGASGNAIEIRVTGNDLVLAIREPGCRSLVLRANLVINRPEARFEIDYARETQRLSVVLASRPAAGQPLEILVRERPEAPLV